jgi:hypothetical protein
MRRVVQLLIKNNLRKPRAVALINKDQIAEVAPLVHPAHEDYIFVGVRRAQIPAIIRPLQCSE